MPYNPADPGPVLDTYDPDWEARFDAADRELKRLQALRNPRRDGVRRQQLLAETIAALYAQFRYGWQLDAFLRKVAGPAPLPDDPPDLLIPSPPHNASPAEMQAHYIEWTDRLEEQRFLAALPTPAEWDDGVFAETPPEGVARELRDTSVGAPWKRLPAHMRLVVERHPGVTHVCVIQRAGEGSSMINDAAIMDWVAAQYLLRPGLLARLWRSRPCLVFHHTHRPTPHGPPGQPVWGSALRWGFRDLRVEALETRQATPWLRAQALEFAPDRAAA